MRSPNFIIGGTSAGGTSFLSAVLIQHPEIYLPVKMRPEPHFFYKSWEYERGIDYYLSRWFPAVPDSAIAVGERSSSYLFGGEAVASRISAQYPNIKFIFTLRNPIERTWANYRYTVLNGFEDQAFEDALRHESERIQKQTGIWAEIQPHNYTGRGFYARQIRQFMNYFPLENMMFIKSEYLSTQTEAELSKIYDFLKLSVKDSAYERSPDHTSVNVKNPKVQRDLRVYFGDKFDEVIEATRKEESLEGFISTEKDEAKINELRSNLIDRKISMSLSARSYLREVFHEDINDLKNLIDFDVADWQ